MRARMQCLHDSLARLILDPSDERSYEDIDEQTYMIWEWCTVHGRHPWGWCLDRYCACKVALSAAEPAGLLPDPQAAFESLP